MYCLIDLFHVITQSQSEEQGWDAPVRNRLDAQRCQTLFFLLDFLHLPAPFITELFEVFLVLFDIRDGELILVLISVDSLEVLEQEATEVVKQATGQEDRLVISFDLHDWPQVVCEKKLAGFRA